jgi:hypothetical protein
MAGDGKRSVHEKTTDVESAHRAARLLSRSARHGGSSGRRRTGLRGPACVPAGYFIPLKRDA